MDRFPRHARRCAGPAVALAAAGLVLAACGSSPGSPSASSSGKPSSGSTSSTSSTQSSSAGTSYFPIAVGNTWVYQNSLGGTTTNKVLSVTPVSGGNEATLSNMYSLSHSATQVTYIFHNDGSITYPSNQFGNGVTIVGGSLYWPPPSVIASGQPTHSTLKIAIDEAGQHLTETAHITVQGAGTTTVTVPAGTYQAAIVTMTMAASIEGYSVTIEVRSWVANGTGPVQSQVETTDLGTTRVTDVQKLESFTKG